MNPILGEKRVDSDPAPVVNTRNSRLATRKRATAVAAVSVALALVAVGVALTNRSARVARPVTTSSPLLPPSQQAGYQRISYHGATLFVPPQFVVRADPCYVPNRDSVEVTTNAIAYCPFMRVQIKPPRFTNIQLQAADTDDNATIARTRLLIDGVSALRGSGTIKGEEVILAASSSVTVIVVPSANLSIDIAGPDQGSAAASLLESIRIASTDDLGCAAQLPTLTPTGNPPSTDFVPMTPAAGVVCEYASREYGQTNQWLDGSQLLTATQLQTLVRFLNGVSRSSNSSTTEAGLTDRYQLLEPGGVIRTIAVSLGGNGLRITDGNRSIGVDYSTTACFSVGCRPTPLPDVYAGAGGG